MVKLPNILETTMISELYGRYLVKKAETDKQHSPLIPVGYSSSKKNPSGAIPVEIIKKPEFWSVTTADKWNRLKEGDVVWVDIARLEEYDIDMYFIKEDFIFGKSG
jgi:hypothetical protein